MKIYRISNESFKGQKTIERLKDILNKIGATLDESTMDYCLTIDAPKGYVWKANGETSYPIHYATTRQAWLIQALKMEMPNLKMGLEKVTDPKEIERIRWDKDEDNWGAPPNAPDFIPWPNEKI